MTATESLAPIRDLETGIDWLSRLPLSNPPQAKTDLDTFLDLLLRTPPETKTYLELLEHSHDALYFVEEDLARRFTDRPLPLNAKEERCFREVIATWLRVARGYAHCAVRDKSIDDPAHGDRVALMMHRCIHFTGKAIVEHQRARRQLPPRLWNDMLGYFATAEKWSVATKEVSDPLGSPGRSVHCTAAFVNVLLAELASPCGLSMQDQNLVRRWATTCAPLVSVARVTDGDLPEFVIDLTQDQALLPSRNRTTPRNKLRTLDTSRLTEQLKEYRRQLKEKTSPSKLGLGHDCDSRQCNRLLKHIARPWSQVRLQRKFRRLNSSGTIELCMTPASIHLAIFGGPLIPSAGNAGPTKLQAETVTGETWTIVNHSPSGFRLMRSITGERIAHGQLIAFRTHPGTPFLLAQTTWLMQEHGGNLIAGIAVLPGKPEAMAIRIPANDNTPAEPFRPAFMLPVVPGIEEESTLIIPHGLFRVGQSVEIYSSAVSGVQLKRLISEGPDFDRVSFTTA